jgi:copper/silver efflux system protein
VLEGQQSYALVVRFGEAARGDLATLSGALIDTPSGAQVPLSALAEVRNDRGPNAISRENVQRKIVIQSNVSGRDVGSVVEDIRRQRVARAGPAPAGLLPGVRRAVRVGGRGDAHHRPALAALARGDLPAPLHGVPLDPAGAAGDGQPAARAGRRIAAVVLTGGVLNIATLVGFITLFGIAVRNGILMVSHYNHLLAEGSRWRRPSGAARWSG